LANRRGGRLPYVPSRNEPPELLIQTLRSLSRLHRTHSEVLVMVRLAPPDPATCPVILKNRWFLADAVRPTFVA